MMAATVNNRSIADTEAHVADICTWQLGGKGNLFLFYLIIIICNFFFYQ